MENCWEIFGNCWKKNWIKVEKRKKKILSQKIKGCEGYTPMSLYKKILASFYENYEVMA